MAMAKKRRKLDDFLSQRKKTQEAQLEEHTQLSNLLFRLGVGALLTLLLLGLKVLRFQDRSPAPDVTFIASLGVLLFVLMGLVVLNIRRTQPGLFSRASSFNQFTVLIVLEVLLFECICMAEWSPYLAPLPIFAMVATLVFNEGIALLLSSVLTFYMGLTSLAAGTLHDRENPLGLDMTLALVLAMGAATAVLGTKPIRKQTKPFIVGLYAGLVQAVGLIALAFLGGGIARGETAVLGLELADWKQAGWGLAGGVVSGVVVTCLLPGIERLFGILTERRLLDLSDFNNVLLQLLQERAPGTFQHTLNVSQLASSAAEAIGGDSLLARVGAYYHDLGKVYKPEYFVENMGEDKSIHERLHPSMSKMIIISHVKDGMHLAREAKLPQKIIDMIPMHHGTTLVEFFYEKARRAALAEGGTATDGQEYRYPGPRPRFREAGILMLADTLEAMAKAEQRPNPSRFSAMVRAVIQKRLQDGQLDESDLTLNDLRLIGESFVRTLTTMYHGRIQYPRGDDDRGLRGARAEQRPGHGGRETAPQQGGTGLEGFPPGGAAAPGRRGAEPPPPQHVGAESSRGARS
jgi:hypothetical protein